MQKIFLFAGIIFLTGCGAVLPSQQADISNFVPAAPAVEQVLDVPAGEFAAENFPDECDWMGVDRVIDGDTIKLVDGTSVRMVGIDTPETVHPRKPVQWCGPEASRWTKNMFKDVDTVCLITDEKNDKLDKYGRRLAYPFTPDGTDVCAELVERGLARGYYYFPMEREAEFRSLEKSAQDAEIGIWSKDSETPDCVFQPSS